MASRRHRHEEHEGHGNHERWLITYADLITLLMVLFIVMFAISQVDQKRFMQLKEGMAAGFGQNVSPFQGAEAVMPETGAQPLAPVRPPEVDGVRPTGPIEPSSRGGNGRASVEGTVEYAAAAAEVGRLDELRSRLETALRARGLDGDVRMAIGDRGLGISLVSEHIVFAPDLADLTPRGARVLDTLAPVLRALPEQLEIAGHTNQVQVKPKYYPTDWDLSAARAVTVLRHLEEQQGIAAQRLSAVAFGHVRPLIDPSEPRSQVLNKRVDILVVSQAPEETRDLFDDVLRDRKV